jgi:hypothetical protein
MTLTAMGLPTDGSSSKYEAMAAESEDPNRKVKRATFDILAGSSLSTSSSREKKTIALKPVSSTPRFLLLA